MRAVIRSSRAKQKAVDPAAQERVGTLAAAHTRGVVNQRIIRDIGFPNKRTPYTLVVSVSRVPARLNVA
jgi:hypothetical protein